MNRFKKIIVTSLLALSSVACTVSKLEVQKENVKVVSLKGPTSMGLVKFMKDSEQEKKYQFKIVSSVDEVTPLIAKGEVDIATVPANLSSVLYNNTKKSVKVLGINTLGVLYLVETGNQLKQLSDLKGKTIYASGKGATPEYSLRYLLEKNGIRDVRIEWKSEHAEVVQALARDSKGIALLPEPFVSVVSTKNPKIHVALDLNKEWEKITGSPLVTGVVIARKEFVEKYPDTVKDFLMKYEKSVSFVNSHGEEAAKLIGQYDIVKESIAKKALLNCPITLVQGNALKTQLANYLDILNRQNPKAIGGALPGDDFYYGAQK
ncbi:ABC transporter substrate-binding protein [Bulleidia sp. zg-1006]|uniref:ABC transporter substrate-binding protein n=1 Tax=Bulleidia sp. zg-1006 TaxID=2806552 RepID=UPI001EED26B9|nr:MqnA/MqnD/SBP family protein [Bulleidia sp. zg-1006]